MAAPSFHFRTRRRQRGAAAVEFALAGMVFLLIVFGILELARIMYMYNALADATRSAARAAANINWNDTTALDRARQRAILRDTPGHLPFGAPVTDRHIRIDYMYLRSQAGVVTLEPLATSLMPASPARNRHNCLVNPYGAAAPDTVCVRLVRARICQPDGVECVRENYQMLLSLVNLGVPLPFSTTIVNAETFGYRPGDGTAP